jgi:hypothetical protein
LVVHLILALATAAGIGGKVRSALRDQPIAGVVVSAIGESHTVNQAELDRRYFGQAFLLCPTPAPSGTAHSDGSGSYDRVLSPRGGFVALRAGV